jgi:hypothetical protein
MMLSTCDFCNARFSTHARTIAAIPRPSDPSELCAVMWGCGECEHSRDLPTPAQLEEQLETGLLPGIAFISV